jgi:hypothetical protein
MATIQNGRGSSAKICCKDFLVDMELKKALIILPKP